MNFFLFELGVPFAAGIGAGALYFRLLWWSTRRFAQGGRLAVTIALAAGRFLLLAAALLLASRHGALPLLVMTSGIFAARVLVSRRVRAATA